MSDDELLAIYHKAWDLYYSPEHVERVLRRTKAWGYDLANMRSKMFGFQATATIEGIHPLEGGIFRRKYRRDRRPGMRRESPFVFYPGYAAEIVSKIARCGALYWRYKRILERVRRGPGPDMDVAMQPVQDADLDALELFTATEAARAAAEKQRRWKAVVVAAEAERRSVARQEARVPLGRDGTPGQYRRRRPRAGRRVLRAGRRRAAARD